MWGTHWSCTPKAVNSAITKFCGVTPKSVKRKFVKNATGKTTRWLFVIHDSEEVLTSLESKWDQLKLQTLWELEPCFMKEMPASQSSASTESPTVHQSEDTSVFNQPPKSVSSPEASSSSRTDRDLIPNENSAAGLSSTLPPSSSEDED